MVRIRGHTWEHQRKDRRLDTPIRVQIDGRIYSSIDWSFGGFLLDEYDGDLGSGWEFKVEALGLEEGQMIPVSAPCRSIRVVRQTLAAAFNGLSSQTYDVLEGLTMYKLRFPDD